MTVMINEDYVSFETAKLLKEKGFECATLHYYYDKDGDLLFSAWGVDAGKNEFVTPTLQMAMKWLREKYKITIGVLFKGDRIYYEINQNNEFILGVDTPESYEKVCDEAIRHCLKILI